VTPPQCNRCGTQEPDFRFGQTFALPVAKGRGYRLISRELGLSKNTVADIVKQNRSAARRA
jgi:hypothetical protein